MAVDANGRTIVNGDVYLIAGEVLDQSGDDILLLHGDRGQHAVRVKAGQIVREDEYQLNDGSRAYTASPSSNVAATLPAHLARIQEVNDLFTLILAAAQPLNARLTAISAGTDIPIGDGGTGQSTAQAAIDALTVAGDGTDGQVWTTDGTNGSWQTPAGGSAGTILMATGSNTDSIANTAVDVTWAKADIADAALTISSAELTAVGDGIREFDVSVRTTSNNRTELIIRTYLDTGSGWVEQTDYTASDYVARDSDQNTGGASLHFAINLSGGDKVKFEAEGDCDGTCTLTTAGTLLRAVSHT